MSKESNQKCPQGRKLFLSLAIVSFSLLGSVFSAAAAQTDSQATSAQQQQPLKGTVVDEKGEPIIGATIFVKETKSGTATDMDGRFSLPASVSQGTLVISFMGYVSQEVKVEGRNDLHIVLKPDNKVLEEVVITGYGTFKKSAYAGAASTVKTNELKDIPVVSFSDMLQGSAPGVQISSVSGQPGAANSINIRGLGSFNASSQPLYVIDGVPVISGDYSALGTDSGLDVMSTISNADIESVTVIKDAAAASLYGSRAANGVIVITTKKGKVGKPVINFKADWGFSDFAMDYRPVMKGEERREFIYDAIKNYYLKYEDCTEAEATEWANEDIEYYAPVPWCGYVDWDALMFQKGNHQTYEVSASGGTDRVKYYTSLNYLKQEGIVRGAGLERMSARANIDYKASEKLTLGGNFLFSTVNQNVYSEGTTYTSPFYALRNKVTPSDFPFNEDGSWNRSFLSNGNRNPLLALEYDFKREYMTRSFNTIFGEYEFIHNLKLKSTLSYDYNINKGKQWSDPHTSNGEKDNGIMHQLWSESRKMVWANQLTYNVEIQDDHHLDFLLGYETDSYDYDYISGTKTNFAHYQKNALSNGSQISSLGGYDSHNRMVSYLARANYDFKNKYFLGGSARIDGSSRLASDNRWGCFWSVSGAWRIIEESFMEPVKGWLSDLKFRVSYGVNGTLPSDYYGYMGLASLTSSYINSPAYTLSQIENTDLSWEKNHNLNIGLDFSFWSRLNVTLEYYTRRTKDLLMDYPVSMVTGYSSYLKNIGEVENKGVELEISSTNFDKRDFKWNTTFTLSHNKNKIVKLDGDQTEIISGAQIRQVGKSYRTFYLIEFAGINPETGAPQFYTNDKDANGNYIKEITENPSNANRIAMKHAEPTVTGGLSNTLRYKWFDLNFMFSYQFGGYTYDNWAQKTEHGGSEADLNVPIYYRDAWKQPGDITQYEAINWHQPYPMKSYSTSRRLHSSDFIRLRNLTFGITLPNNWTKKAGLQTVRFYASGNNLWTWAKWDFYDPEAASGGSASWQTPPLKTLTFGVNITL